MSLALPRAFSEKPVVINGVLPVLVGLLSLAVTGFQYGVLNDVFHIPIVQHAYRWPQFEADPFYQDLRLYSSAFWPVLSLAGRGAATPNAFFCLFVLIRVLTFVSLAFLLLKMGLSGAERVMTLLIVAVSENTLGLTRVGYEDMLVAYLDHTSLAWPLIFWSIGLACERKLLSATALTGLLFCANAFVAVWHALALALVTGGLTLNRRGGGSPLTRREALTKFVLGGLVAVAIAAPVLFWTLKGLLSTPPYAAFSYRAFLSQYFPNHFLIQAATPLRLLSLLILLVSGSAALRRLGAEARTVSLFLLGYTLVFCIGAGAPLVFDARFLLNLHLLRVDGCIVFLCVIAAGALSARLILKADVRRSLLGLGVLIGTTVARASPLMLLVLAANGLRPAGRPAGRLSTGALAAAAVILAVAAMFDVRSAVPANPDLQAEQDLGKWLDRSSPLRTQVLARTAVNPTSGLEELQLFSKRRVYVDWKRGATTMWRPDFYAYWRSRMNEVSGLTSLNSALAFACGHDLGVVVERSAGLRGRFAATVVYQNPTFAALRPTCKGRPS